MFQTVRLTVSMVFVSPSRQIPPCYKPRLLSEDSLYSVIIHKRRHI